MHDHSTLDHPTSEHTQSPPFVADVVGIDLSLTGTGYAAADGNHTRVGLVTSKPADGLSGFIDRCHRIVENVVDLAGIQSNTLVVIEGLSMHSKSSSLDRIYGNWWLAISELVDFLAADPIVVTPTQRAKYATGKGNAGKDTVMLEAARRYPEIAITDNNTADATILLAMGMRHRGNPIDSGLSKAHLEAMEKINWTN